MVILTWEMGVERGVWGDGDLGGDLERVVI